MQSEKKKREDKRKLERGVHASCENNEIALIHLQLWPFFVGILNMNEIDWFRFGGYSIRTIYTELNGTIRLIK